MARKRDARSALIDNIGRQIRRLNAREKSGTLDKYQLKGLERQRENLKAFREEVKKINKNDTTALAKAQYDYKHDGNYTSSQKKIDQNTKRLLGSEVFDLAENLGRPDTEPEDKSKIESGSPPEPEDFGDDGDSGGSTLMDQFDDLFQDLAQIEGKYIGAYAGPEIHDQVNKIIDKASAIAADELNVDDQTRNQLTKLIGELERAKTDSKGNFSVRDEMGKIIGYNNTFNAKQYMESTAPVNFDVEKWINENSALFPNVNATPGGNTRKKNSGG